MATTKKAPAKKKTAATKRKLPKIPKDMSKMKLTPMSASYKQTDASLKQQARAKKKK
jgi:hypothetical protein